MPYFEGMSLGPETLTTRPEILIVLSRFAGAALNRKQQSDFQVLV